MGKIVKKYSRGFTVVNNSVLDDTSLSLQAKGLFVYLWRQPDNWTFSITETARHSSNGIAGTRSTIHELEQHGYLKRQQQRAKGGLFSTGDWILSETPLEKTEEQSKTEGKAPKKATVRKSNENEPKTVGSPMTENPTSVKRTSDERSSVNMTLLNTNIPNTVVVDDVEGAHDQNLTQDHQITTTANQSTKTSSADALLDLWSEVYGSRPNAIIEEQLSEWVESYGLELVMHAMKLALLANRPSDKIIGYMNATLITWQQDSISTVSQAEQASSQWSQQKKNKRRRTHNQSKRRRAVKRHEQLPDWALNGNNKNKATPEQLEESAKLLKRLKQKRLIE